MNKKERQLYNKKYRQTHKQELKKYNINYYQKYKTRWQKYAKKRYQKYKKEIQIYYEKYYQIHKKQLKKQHKKYQQKYLQNPTNRLIQYLRNRINLALKGNPKNSTTMKLVGCSIKKLKQYLEKQFKKGMTWKNYGKWHVDHIKPCIAFDLSKPKEQKKCFHYTNLRPLWASENLKRRR